MKNAILICFISIATVNSLLVGMYCKSLWLTLPLTLILGVAYGCLAADIDGRIKKLEDQVRELQFPLSPGRRFDQL